jgi:hypothetical protein
MVDLRCVRRQLERCEDRTEKQPRPELARNQIGVLTLPADAGSGGERLLHDRGGIDEDPRVAAGLRGQPPRQRVESRLDDVVIVVGPRVNRNRAAVAPAQDRQRIAAGVLAVIKAKHDDGAYLWPQRARVAAPCRRCFHPIHVAVGAFGQELPQPLQRLRDRVRPRDADGVETVLMSGARERRFERRGIV